MKKKMITLRTMSAALLLSAITATTALGGTWTTENNRWKYLDDSGAPAPTGWLLDQGQYYLLEGNGLMKTGWHQDGANWYYLNPNQGGPQGAMKTGWVQENGLWYFLDTRVGGPQGSRMTGWQWIDGKCYYLDPAQNGALAVSCTLADGSMVNADGAWVDASGTVHYEAGKGIPSVLTTQTSTTKSGKGGGGGSSSGGSGGGSGSSGSSSGSSSSSDSSWSNYSDSSVGRSANHYTTGNYGMMSSDEREEVADAIEDFKSTYLTSGMSDFEKEIKIIQWLVENCSYETADDWENATAYSCIVNGKAQCSGYADAFLQTAKACGLDVRYIYNKHHAWNLIKLDGDWYHVDVTFEDPIGSNNYGFSNLRNKYINLEDSQIKTASYHHDWTSEASKAKGIKYGPKVVAQYLKDGTIDTSLSESFKDQVDAIFDSIRNSDGSNIISYTTTDATIDKVYQYMAGRIDMRADSYQFAIRYPSAYTATKAGNYSKVADLNRAIASGVSDRINANYGNVLKNTMKLSFLSEKDADGNYYIRETGSLRYQANQGYQVSYHITYVDQDGNVVGTQSGTGDKGSYVDLQFPDGYNYITSDGKYCQVSSGSVNYTGRELQLKSKTDVNVKITVRNKKSTTTDATKNKASQTSVTTTTQKTETQQISKGTPDSAQRQ